ncbi:hypothetical protein [Streptosporangium sp. CA-115845]|uniref:hypothetical protein n=1 Tax=Streptosporangium sp. CA-115845 TaxID=3240071 RepID=UPI003D8DFC32
MKFLAITLIVHGPNPITGELKSTNARLREVVENAAPAVLIALVAAATSAIRVGSGAVQLGHQNRGADRRHLPLPGGVAAHAVPGEGADLRLWILGGR